MSRHEQIAALVADHRNGLVTITEGRMELGTASWKERLAYRFPRRFGGLYPLAAEDRRHPGERERKQRESAERLAEAFRRVNAEGRDLAR